MLPRIILLAALVCVVAVFAAGRMPQMLAALDRPDASAEPGPAPAPAPPPAAGGRQVVLRKGAGGHVTLDAVVNGRTVQMMVDTGASMVALSGEDARRLGIDPARSAYSVTLRTANGLIRAAPVRLGEVRVGDVSIHDVDAVVLPMGAMDGNLLGMSFLNRLRKFEFQGGELVLTQ